MQSVAATSVRPPWQRLAALCLLHWHLCSLDAPTVAVVWAIALNRLAGLRLHPAQLLVLALGTWIVYVLDRLLDSLAAHRTHPALPHPKRTNPSHTDPVPPRLPKVSPLSRRFRSRPKSPAFALPQHPHLKDRHHFHWRHRRSLLALCLLAATALALLCRSLPTSLIELYCALTLPVALYALGVHHRLLLSTHLHPTTPHTHTKEAAVAILFTAAVAAPSLQQAPPAARPALLVAASLLALLCWLNCALIGYGESPQTPNRSRERTHLALCTLALAAAAAADCLWTNSPQPPAAILLSSLLLLSLLLGLRDLPSNARRLRVLADLGLLTPILFLLPRVQL